MRYILVAGLILVSSVCYAETVRVVYSDKVYVIIPSPNTKTPIDKIFNDAMNNNPDLKGKPYEDMDKASLPNDNGKFKDRRYWVKNPNGKGVVIDENKKANDLSNATENKLKKIGITKEELKELLK